MSADPDAIRARARFLREETVRLIAIAKTGHYASSFSCAEILAVLYDGVLQLRFLAGQIAVQYSLRLAKVAMRLRIAFVQSERFRCRFHHSRISLERFCINVRQPIPCLRDTGPSTREVCIFIQCALEKIETFPHALLVALVREIKTL